MHAWTAIARGPLLLLCLLVAVLLLRAAPRRATNRLGAAWLVVTALWMGSLGASGFATDGWAFTLLIATAIALGMASKVAFLAFVGSLGGRATRRLRGRLSLVAFSGAVAFVVVLPFLSASNIVVPVPGDHTAWNNRGLGGLTVAVTALLTVPIGIALLLALRREAAPGSLERTRATLLVAAVVAFEGYIAFQSGFMFVLNEIDRDLHLAYMDGTSGYLFLTLGVTLAQTVGILLLAYGILKTQLFDIDLKVRVGVVRGTIVAVFLGVFFLVEQAAQAILSEAFGVVLGLVAAALLVPAIRPLERGAGRVADRVMPRVHDTPEYRDARKDEVYRSAVRGALADGVLTADEEYDLARLAAHLQLDAVRSLSLRREVEAELGMVLGARAAGA